MIHLVNTRDFTPLMADPVNPRYSGVLIANVTSKCIHKNKNKKHFFLSFFCSPSNELVNMTFIPAYIHYCLTQKKDRHSHMFISVPRLGKGGGASTSYGVYKYSTYSQYELYCV